MRDPFDGPRCSTLGAEPSVSGLRRYAAGAYPRRSGSGVPPVGVPGPPRGAPIGPLEQQVLRTGLQGNGPVGDRPPEGVIRGPVGCRAWRGGAPWAHTPSNDKVSRIPAPPAVQSLQPPRPGLTPARAVRCGRPCLARSVRIGKSHRSRGRTCRAHRFLGATGEDPEPLLQAHQALNTRAPGPPSVLATAAARRGVVQSAFAAGLTMPRTVRDFTNSPIAVISHSPLNCLISLAIITPVCGSAVVRSKRTSSSSVAASISRQ
jgi:hypothetical protein